MHKKLEAELVSLAHSILQLKNNDDVSLLHTKARDIYEKLTVLKFVNANINGVAIEVEANDEVTEEIIPEVKEVKVEETIEVVPEIIAIEETEEVVEEVAEEIIAEVSEDIIEGVAEEISEEIVEEVSEDSIEEVAEAIEVVKKVLEETTEEFKEMLTNEQVEAIFGNKNESVKDDERDLQSTLFTLEDEFKDAISSDVATSLFEKATKENPIIEEPKETIETKARSLNDTIFNSNLQVGLNDRIAFVKHLFEDSQEDFNRVLSQLNSFKTEAEAKEFLQGFVKLDYDWSDKEEYESRFMTIIERKFL